MEIKEPTNKEVVRTISHHCFILKMIGKRISLISKKNIRYEGLLYSINEQNMTVALQNVRSYGTEGRELEPLTDPTTGAVTTTGQFVPPNDDVHAYLLFRGQDIKDLHVHESQPAVAEPTVTPEPTAVAVTKPAAPPPTTPTPTTTTVPPASRTSDVKPTPAPRSSGRSGRGGPRKPEVTGVGTGASLLSHQERRATTTTMEEFAFAPENATKSGDAVEPPVAAVAAYAKDDFFDSISCEALDKQAGMDNRLRGNQERRLNTETFGAVALNNTRRRGRGSYGGRSGRLGTDAGRSNRGNGSYRGAEGGRGRGRGRSGGRGGRGRGYDGRPPESRSEGVPRPAATTASS
jgi:protein LSM14